MIMVRTRDPRWKGDCFWPVDTEGVFLPPEEFSANQTRAYLASGGGQSVAGWGRRDVVRGPGSDWRGARSPRGSRDVWTSMGLEWILVRNELPQDVGQPVEPTYLLLPTGAPVDAVANRATVATGQPVESRRASDAPSLEVRWGHAPGREAPGEASAAEKVAASAGSTSAATDDSINCRPRPSSTCDRPPGMVVDEVDAIQMRHSAVD